MRRPFTGFHVSRNDYQSTPTTIKPHNRRAPPLRVKECLFLVSLWGVWGLAVLHWPDGHRAAIWAPVAPRFSHLLWIRCYLGRILLVVKRPNDASLFQASVCFIL